MLLPLRLPKTLLWVLNLLVIYTLLFTAFRLLTLLLFMPEGTATDELLPSFLLGLRFDLRWISILLLPIVLVSTLPQYSPYYSSANKKAWTWYLAVTTFFVVLIYTIDFGCFAYYRVRLGATVLNFADDAAIATVMLWESYPVVWMIFGLVMLVFVLRFLFHRMHKTVSAKTDGKGILYQRKWFLATALLLGILVYGGAPQPLKWNAAFQMKNDFSGYLALNPLQSVFSTLQNRKPHFDEGKAKDLYPALSSWMGWDPEAGTYKKYETPASSFFRSKPNIVLVVCESFSMYKTSMSGNPLNTTPYFQKLSDSSIFFNRCFTPHFSTARGMFATITGIPDVQLAKFSTRTEAVENQHTIVNNFEGYNKFYFLGGSPAFNNFEGLMKNVKGVQMVTEGAFVSQPIDVWGISDKNLFLEANKLFAKQKEPFFAIIQSSDNHPPYTIAEEDKDFVRKEPAEKELEKYGFESAAEYNAIRYFDYGVEKFMEAAKREAYFQNTLFVFVGDHGVAGNATEIFQKEWTENRLTEMHVPLLFYAPGKLPAQLRTETVSQIDVLPTTAGIAGQKHLNSTLGRDVVNKQNNHSAFFIRHDEGEIGLITDDFYFTKNILFEKEKLQLLNKKATYTQQQLDSVQKRLSGVTSGYLETARWMLMNNKTPLSP
ncbi:MAG TPA: sulfatase-like hydrolase/transferase [Flavisolibacter sp.]|nr:sulfatase-like hydrolase/transferase [Flavisolibacter sp.]